MTTQTLDRPAPTVAAPTIAPSRLYPRARISAIMLLDEMAQLDADERDAIMFDVLVALLRADKAGNGISASGIECLLAHAAQEVKS